MLAILCAVILVLYRHPISNYALVTIAVLAGSAAGWGIAMRVSMIQIPAMVAFQHGAGGVAAFLVSYIELSRNSMHLTGVAAVSGIIGLIIGAATFSGSMVAGGKLANKLKQAPTVLRGHNLLLVLIVICIAIVSAVPFYSGFACLCQYAIALIILSIILGVVFSMRIGGADMPVLISFLNASAGLAASFCGVVIDSKLLTACGATVVASGSLLTIMMCRAMNRSLLNIFKGITPARPQAGTPVQADTGKQKQVVAPRAGDPFEDAVEIIRKARTVIFVPGYGMAMAQAQFQVVSLYNKLEGLGKSAKFAIHPVAGRMPGHMNVLLAEADLPYEKLCEMDAVNDEFKDTDLCIVVGACDVVNPAAITAEGTPIYGMQILRAHEAKNVIVFNMDTKPGYSGVENPLYRQDNAVLLLGNAAETLDKVLKADLA